MVVCVVSGINESRIRNVDMIYILDLILTVVVKYRAINNLLRRRGCLLFTITSGFQDISDYSIQKTGVQNQYLKQE